MKSEFQDVFKDAYYHWIDDACSQRYYASRNLALQVWKNQQSKVDALTLQVAEMKSRLNDAYTYGQSAMYKSRQSRVIELQKRLDAALEVVKQGIREQCGDYYLEKVEELLEGGK